MGKRKRVLFGLGHCWSGRFFPGNEQVVDLAMRPASWSKVTLKERSLVVPDKDGGEPGRLPMHANAPSPTSTDKTTGWSRIIGDRARRVSAGRWNAELDEGRAGPEQGDTASEPGVQTTATYSGSNRGDRPRHGSKASVSEGEVNPRRPKPWLCRLCQTCYPMEGSDRCLFCVRQRDEQSRETAR